MQISPARFLGSTLLVLVAALGVVASVNYRCDPANIFGDRTYEAGVAALMVQGKDVANLEDYDERLVQKFFAEKLIAPREVLIVGSSRTMNLVPEYFRGPSFYNASVSGASLEDHYAILQIFREHGLLPRRLILGIDPWIFNRHSEQTRWKSLEAEYGRSRSLPKQEAGGNAMFDGHAVSRLRQLISFDYLRASLKAASTRHDRNYYVTDAAELDVNIRRADGTITYKRAYSHRSIEEVRNWVSKQASQTPIYSMGGFSALDKEYSAALDELLNRLHGEGIQVTLFLAPYHPDMYAVLTRDGSPYRAVLGAEQYVRALAKSRGLPLLGSFDPAVLGCGDGDFYDEMHPKPSCLDRIMSGQETQPTAR